MNDNQDKTEKLTKEMENSVNSVRSKTTTELEASTFDTILILADDLNLAGTVASAGRIGSEVEDDMIL